MAENSPESKRLEEQYGNPLELWSNLLDQVQVNAIQKFDDVARDWLELMWSLDRFRTLQVVPAGFAGNSASLNRRKGQWFSQLIANLLQNQTTQEIACRHRIEGFSQEHQMDVAWPARKVDPLICIDTRVSGAPEYGSTPPRGAMSDFSSRRKEIKFAAADLKLFRRQHFTTINHWDAWRRDAPPQQFFLWAARLTSDESLDKLIAELESMVKTYVDGAGVVAWSLGSSAAGYEYLPIPRRRRMFGLDDVLYRVSSEISKHVDGADEPPDPVVPSQRALDELPQ